MHHPCVLAAACPRSGVSSQRRRRDRGGAHDDGARCPQGPSCLDECRPRRHDVVDDHDPKSVRPQSACFVCEHSSAQILETLDPAEPALVSRRTLQPEQSLRFHPGALRNKVDDPESAGTQTLRAGRDRHRDERRRRSTRRTGDLPKGSRKRRREVPRETRSGIAFHRPQDGRRRPRERHTRPDLEIVTGNHDARGDRCQRPEARSTDRGAGLETSGAAFGEHDRRGIRNRTTPQPPCLANSRFHRSSVGAAEHGRAACAGIHAHAGTPRGWGGSVRAELRCEHQHVVRRALPRGAASHIQGALHGEQSRGRGGRARRERHG